MSFFWFSKKDLKIRCFFHTPHHYALKIKNKLLKIVHFFSKKNLAMDNKKGKKGKMFFIKYYMTIYDNILYKYCNKFMTVLVTDNGKGKNGKCNLFK